MNANWGNWVKELVNVVAPQEVATPTVHRDPLLILWKKARPTNLDGIWDPLIAQGWFQITETIIEGMELSDNKKVKCTSYSLTMDVKIWMGDYAAQVRC